MKSQELNQYKNKTLCDSLRIEMPLKISEVQSDLNATPVENAIKRTFAYFFGTEKT